MVTGESGPDPRMDVQAASPVAPQAKKRRNANKLTLQEIALRFIRREGNAGSCRIDESSNCSYTQVMCDVGNFVRHFRTQHPNAARRHGLFTEKDAGARKPRPIAKRLIAIDRRLLIESVTKLVCYHNLPLSCVEWEGLKQLLDPIASALDVALNRGKNKMIIHAIANRVRAALGKEIKNILLSLKVDSASRFHRHVLGINVQYVLDGKIIIRTLGMVEIKERQTAAFLKSKILDVLQSYGVSIEQIFSVTVDNGANMVAAVKGLKQEFDMLFTQQLLPDGDGECEPIENEDEIERAAIESQELTESLTAEFQEQLNLVRCAVHTLQLAVLDVIDKKNDSVKNITEIARKCRSTKYIIYFDRSGATVPPIWSPTRWGGIFKMVSSFLRQKDFFVQFGIQFPEVELTSKIWEFIEHYVQAFEPLDICTKKLQERHVSLSDFYIAWLMTINAVRNMFSNPFAQQLTKTLTDRLVKLKSSQAFQMALFMDPRMSFLNSKLFNEEEKLHIQTCIKDTWYRIRRLKPSPPEMPASYNPNGNSQFDDFVTELYGGTLSKTTNDATDSSFAQQLKALEAEPRQDHTFDVFKHWLKRRETHPELFEVAMVVIATPSNQVSVERSFSALALILTSHRVGLGQESLEDILIIKLNRDIFEKEAEMIDWDDLLSNGNV